MDSTMEIHTSAQQFANCNLDGNYENSIDFVDDAFDSQPPKFGATPHPEFDSDSVLDKLRDVTVGQLLMNAVHENLVTRDGVIEEIMSEVRRKLLEPGLLPEDIAKRVDKVYTIGCFDVFHPGHELLLKRMRAYGRKVIVGVHDSNSIHQLKGIWPVDSTAKRMFNVKEYADVVFCVAGTDPTPFIVSAIDLKKGETALYIRGNDMANFPSKDVVSAIMPIKFLPYSSGISSSQLRRTIRSQGDESGEPTDDVGSTNDGSNGSSSQDQSSIDTSDDMRDGLEDSLEVKE